jgi:hypothetical protein
MKNFIQQKKPNDLQISSVQKRKKGTSLSKKKKNPIIFKFLRHWEKKRGGTYLLDLDERLKT